MADLKTSQFANKPAYEDGAWLSRYASIAIRKQLAEIQNGVQALPNDVSRNGLAPIAKTLFHDGKEVVERKFKVGIIGAGAAGLFTGMLFDHLKEEYGLDVEYEILETNSDNRVGGRLYTHYFDPAKKGKGNHEYYDVGAMRFPDSDVMKPTFGLFNELGMKEYKPSDNKVWDPEPGDLVPYYLESDNTVELFNDVSRIFKKEGEKARAKDFRITGLPEYETRTPPGALVKEEINGFVERLKYNPVSGWKHLMRIGDNKSVRQFFLDQLDFNTTEWLETYSYGTGWYDQALSEYILETVNFESDPDKWFCVEGGSQQTAYRMLKKIEEKGQERVSFNKTVTKIERLVTTQEYPPKGPLIAVQVAGEKDRREYDAVFNSAPLGAMQRMDLKDVNLNWGTKQAIRALGYGASCKAGIRFKKMWWMSKEFGFDIKGGVSHTDLPIRMCVYPSYNIHDDPEKSGVLLCSYSWSSDAQRIGTLISRDSPKNEDELKTLLLENLAKLHGNLNKDWPYEKLLEKLYELYDGHFAYDWYNDKGTSGAFAYFGPGQFQNMYPYVIRNDGVHVIIGEAASAHHAWVVGAIESAVRGVYQFLYRNSEHSKICDHILELYNCDKISAPWGPIPHEFDRTDDVKPLDPNTGAIISADSRLANGNGEWLRQGVQVEMWRLAQGGDRLDPSKVEPAQVKEFTVLVEKK